MRRSILRYRVTTDASVAEIAIGNARTAEKEDFQEPIQDDGDATGEERVVTARPDINVVEYQQNERQYSRRAHDVQRIRQRYEPPFSCGETEDVADDDAEGNENWK